MNTVVHDEEVKDKTIHPPKGMHALYNKYEWTSRNFKPRSDKCWVEAKKALDKRKRSL